MLLYIYNTMTFISNNIIYYYICFIVKIQNIMILYV